MNQCQQTTGDMGQQWPHWYSPVHKGSDSLSLLWNMVTW